MKDSTGREIKHGDVVMSLDPFYEGRADRYHLTVKNIDGELELRDLGFNNLHMEGNRYVVIGTYREHLDKCDSDEQLIDEFGLSQEEVDRLRQNFINQPKETKT